MSRLSVVATYMVSCTAKRWLGKAKMEEVHIIRELTHRCDRKIAS